MAELKKCPFCGGEARIYITGDNDGYRVACKKILACGAKLEWFDKEEDAIEAWNNRATEAEIRTKTYNRFSTETARQFIDFDAEHDFISIGVCLDIIAKVAEQLKERE